MRILVLTQCYLPMTISGAKLIHELAAEFARVGHEVAVVTPDDSLDRAMTVTREDGVGVVRVRTGTIRHSVGAVRAVREIGLAGTCFPNGWSTWAC